MNEFNPVLNINTPDTHIATSGIGMNQKVNPNDTRPMNNKVGFSPALIVGSLLGLNSWRQKKNREIEQQKIVNSLPIYQVDETASENESPKKQNNSFFESTGSFYKDMEKMKKNLSVQFSPVGVHYNLKEKGKEYPVETIEISEMPSNIKRAWERQNEDLFLNLMYANILSRANIAETMFAKRMLLKHTGLVKRASEDVSEDYSIIDLDNYVEKSSSLIMKSTVARTMFEKIAEEITEDEDFYEFNFELPRPFSVYAEELDFLGEEKLAFRPLGFSSNKNKLFDQSYLKRNVKPVFMPDRVLFVANKNLLSTLATLGMNEDGYEHFMKKDKAYFKNLFLDEAKKNISEVDWNAIKQRERFEKKAGEIFNDEILTPADAFVRADVHPIIYFDLLNQKYGEEWYSLDPYVLIKNIEVDFTKGLAIDSNALNKILSIQSLNNSSSPYVSYHAFEKIVRSFNDKAIDFERRENEDLDSFSLAFSIDIMEKVTPTIDVYGRFSPEVIEYIAQTLAQREIYLYATSVGKQTPFREYFISLLNIRISDALKKHFLSSSDAISEASVSRMVDTISSCSFKVLENLSEGAELNELISYFCGEDKKITDTVRVQVKLCQAVDKALLEKDELLERQRVIYNAKSLEKMVNNDE